MSQIGIRSKQLFDNRTLPAAHPNINGANAMWLQPDGCVSDPNRTEPAPRDYSCVAALHSECSVSAAFGCARATPAPPVAAPLCAVVRVRSRHVTSWCARTLARAHARAHSVLVSRPAQSQRTPNAPTLGSGRRGSDVTAARGCHIHERRTRQQRTERDNTPRTYNAVEQKRAEENQTTAAALVRAAAKPTQLYL